MNLAAFDEDALAALANKGIVRRAARDVEEGKASLTGWEGETAIVAADGETVRIDARGPARASCSCPAPGVCRHRIAAVLLLQRQESETTPPAEPAPSLIEEIAAIPEAALIRFAGRAAWRAAAEMAAAGAELAETPGALVIRLAGEESEVRYLRGLGIEGMVSKASPARRRALHAAALIAVRRSAGVEPSEAAPSEPADAPAALDPGFLDEIRAALADACRNALSLAPLALEERLFTLSVSSRADALPRLGAMLRGIARMIRERRGRGLGFDPDHCLGQIAEADALVRALASAQGEARAGLLGTVRQAYAEAGPLHLHGLGGECWRAEGGARGATAWLYDAAGDRWFTASLARGAGQDPFFDPRQAFAIEAALGGQTLARLAQAELRFENVSASLQGRLSGSARPETTGPSAPSRDWGASFERWEPLGERLRTRLAGSLAAPAPREEPVLLWPRRAGRPWFDDLAQRLCWPLEDADGAWIAVSLDYDPDRAAHFDHLMSTAFDPGFTGGVMAAASIAGTGFELRPVALLDAGIRSLDFEKPRTQRRGLGDFLRSYARRGRGGFVPRPRPASLALLGEIEVELTGIAEIGLSAMGRDGSARLLRLAARAGDAGFPTLAGLIEQLAAADDPAPALLACRHATDRVRRQRLILPLFAREELRLS